MTDRSCKTCTHYRPTRSADTGRVLPSQPGACAWEPPPWPVLSAAYSSPAVLRHWRQIDWPRKYAVWPVDGSDCRTWQAAARKATKAQTILLPLEPS